MKWRKIAIALLLWVTLPGGASAAEAPVDGKSNAGSVRTSPNIVFILADDMGWPDLSCYGNKFIETPVIDRLASEGILFTDFYAATPVCSSTRSTIQTGQYSGRTGITDFIPGHWRPYEKLIVPKIDHHLKAGIKTPGNALGESGYVTGHFGKWHLGNQPNKHGYQITERALGSAFAKWHPSKELGPKRIDFLTDASIWFIEQNRDQPFFLTVSHFAVHIPLEARESTISKYEEKEKPVEGVNNPRYAAMTDDLDASVGRILETLKDLDLAKNTIVVFASDNGGLRQMYTKVGELVSSNAPLRDEKGSLYEGGIRSPFIVRWPGVVKPGTVSHEPSTTADLLPTFCEMAGLKLQAQTIDGTSLVKVLKNPDAAQIIVEPRAGALSIDSGRSLVGIPSLPIPIPFAGAVTSPELSLYTADRQYSVAKIALLAYDAETRKHRFSTGPLEGQSYHHFYRFLGFFNWKSTDIQEKSRTFFKNN
ncbi:MAG TPA: arylsulfatase [Verrucomicrobia bacterium]|nr:arylsulfatase [Verrucomicrobiota bacterium]